MRCRGGQGGGPGQGQNVDYDHSFLSCLLSFFISFVLLSFCPSLTVVTASKSDALLSRSITHSPTHRSCFHKLAPIYWGFFAREFLKYHRGKVHPWTCMAWIQEHKIAQTQPLHAYVRSGPRRRICPTTTVCYYRSLVGAGTVVGGSLREILYIYFVGEIFNWSGYIDRIPLNTGNYEQPQSILEELFSRWRVLRFCRAYIYGNKKIEI